MTSKKRKTYCEVEMEKALGLCRIDHFGYLKAAKLHNIPRTTSFRLVKNGSTAKTTCRRKPVFPEEL